MSIPIYLLQHSGQVLLAILIGLLTCLAYYIIKFYRSRSNYPEGPFPLPFVGNILMLRGVNKHVHECFQDIGRNYEKGVFTFWLGTMPNVVIADPDLALEALKKHQFAGRPILPALNETFVEPGSTDVAFADFGKEWEALRKVAHSAIRKYAVTDKFAQLVSDVVDQVVEDIKTKHGIGNEIDIRNYLTLSMFSILSSASFGKNLKIHDEEVKVGIKMFGFFREKVIQITLLFLMPITKYIFRDTANWLATNIPLEHKRNIKNCQDHEESLDKENIRDFTDAMLAAKKEAEAENEQTGGKEDLVKYLRYANIVNTIGDLFTAGSDTTKHTLLWAFLFMATYPEIQEKIREEVLLVVGEEDIPNLNHKQDCNYVSAFIAEILRFRHVAPTGIPHKATVDTKLGGYIIKKDTVITPIIVGGHLDKGIWNDPEVFKPERFLNEEGKFVSKPKANYIPFGAGRRACPGEKLALADLFFFISRFVQKTRDYQITLAKPVDLNGDPYDTNGWVPYDYKIILRERKSN